jgi:protein-S-isoprenylcysteine O-methyltransferase Ste14
MNAAISSQTSLMPQEAPKAVAPIATTSWRLALDWIERIAVLGWYAWFVWRLFPGGSESLLNANWLIIASESLVIGLFLIRRPATTISVRPTDWLLAMGATMLPLSVSPAENPGQFVNPVVCSIVLICGLIIQIRAKVSLGRSLGMVPADRGIKRGGIYQLVRHPMYAGYVISHVGFLLLNPTLWNASVYSVALVVQILRILAEERFLSQNADYREYMQSVRYRLIPGIF